ncbi:hypothetical protein SEVIR_9G503401v4 [Setaria viridis]
MRRSRAHAAVALPPLLALVLVLRCWDGEKDGGEGNGQTSVLQVSFSPSNGSAAGLKRRPPACLPLLEHPCRPHPLSLYLNFSSSQAKLVR